MQILHSAHVSICESLAYREHNTKLHKKLEKFPNIRQYKVQNRNIRRLKDAFKTSYVLILDFVLFGYALLACNESIICITITWITYIDIVIMICVHTNT